jgi:hypothetical protein
MDNQLYHPLKSLRSIRLLHIDEGNKDDPIQGSFEEVELDLSVAYYALSYTWGSGEAVESIHIQDNVLSVLPNLFDALKKLRAHKYTPIWIDRICINQEDSDERTSQVMLMRDVYQSAKLVLVDLGGQLGPDGTKTIVKMIEDFYKRRSSYGEFKYDFHEAAFHPENLCKYGLPQPGDQSWDILCLFLEQPWFSRLWVLQEVVLAADFLVYCGWDRIESRIFLLILETITFFNLDRFMKGASKDPDVMQSIHRGVLIEMYRKAWSTDSADSSEPRPSLLKLAIDNRPAKCSDPRDRIFALLGISCGTVLSDLPPNYQETVTETYLRAARYFIRNGDGAALLYQARTLQRRPNLPSWVPDWDTPQDPDDQILSGPLFDTLISKIFTTGGDEDVSMRVGERANVLFVRGYVFDIVSVLGAAAPNVEVVYDATPQRSGVEELGSMLNGLSQGYPSGEDIDDVWWRTSVCDRHSACDQKAPDRYRELLHLWRIMSSWEGALKEKDIEKFHDLSDKLAHYFPDSRLPDTYEDIYEPKKRTFEYQLSCHHYHNRARNCLTSKGYICRAPRTVAAGDVVAVFIGVEVPYLLRPMGQNQYQLLGNCYCHGIMYGEALDMPGHELIDIEIV